VGPEIVNGQSNVASFTHVNYKNRRSWKNLFVPDIPALVNTSAALSYMNYKEEKVYNLRYFIDK